jgi:Rrf2 family protein
MEKHMFLTKECDYAIRIIRDLADLEIKAAVTICEREHVPLRFAYKILKKLELAGIVCSYRGVYGGYQLVKNPHSLTLFEIVSSVDEDLFLNECLRPDSDCPLNSGKKVCGVHVELERLQRLIVNFLHEKTMDLLI